MIELHNYPPANSSKQKLTNWSTLNRKVFPKLDIVVPENVVKGIVDMKPGIVEVVLHELRLKIDAYVQHRESVWSFQLYHCMIHLYISASSWIMFP